MTLGEFITNNKIKEISVTTDIKDLNNRVKFYNMDMIPVKYWNSKIDTFRHKVCKSEGLISLELIAIIK